MANRLGGEQSLYLRQHADNPVDWYPWGPEAHERARRERRPILLSIGYSACHWCHVMERESFEDPEVARAMNEGFVCVKVDREERPDVDGIYMRAVQALTGHGGWPLTVFLTPEGEPFYGGTYFPPEPRHGLPSFAQLLAAIRGAWEDRSEQVGKTAARIGELLRESTLGPEGASTREGALDDELFRSAVSNVMARFDHSWGGFGTAPKFPQPVVLQLLTEHHAFYGGRETLDAVLHTLRKMARGGIRDHLAGGFHRYSVDRRWLVPHFEKMLYDNALLASVYLRAFQLSGEEAFARVCGETLDYILGDLRSPDGGFYTARDADSEGEEGLFYLWSWEEVAQVLGEDDASLFGRCYDVSTGGNFEGKNILHLPHDLAAIAKGEGRTEADLDGVLARSRAALLEARSQREPPARDEKILASWNALAVRALAEAGAALGEERYTAAAIESASWLLEALKPEGRLLHQVPLREAVRIPAFLDDVAGLGNALLSLHEATIETRWLEAAVQLDQEVEDRFRDFGTGLLHDTAEDAEEILVRPREVMDNPIPSGSSLAAELGLRLGRLLGDDERAERARTIVAREVEAVRRMPSGFGRLLAVGERLLRPPIEVVVVGRRSDPKTGALLQEAHRSFRPGMVVGGHLEGDPPVNLRSTLLEGRKMVEGEPTAYACTGFVCRAPTSDPAILARELAEIEAGPRR